jgi:predicted secreted protein
MTTIKSPTLTVDVVNTYSLSSISGPTTVYYDTNQTYTCTLTENGSASSGQSLSLYVNGSSVSTETTDSDGTASFTIQFTSSGSKTLQVEYSSPNGTVDSPTLTVDVKENTYTLSSISGPTTVDVGASATYTCTLTMNGSGYNGQTLILTYSGPDGTAGITATTDDSGTATWEISFTTAGTYTFDVEYNEP